MARFLSHPRIREFTIRFLAVFILIQLGLRFVPLSFFQETLSRFIGILFAIQVNGIFIPFQEGAFAITPECLGFTSAGIFLALLLGFRHPARSQKWEWGLLGVVTLLVLNLLRVAGVVGMGFAFGAVAAEFFHVVSWFLMSGVAVGLWYALLSRALGTKGVTHLAAHLVK
ncbi:MAG: hypothetical protein Q8P05_05095 [Candidatus Diapherotrites archaeon]|nr:hypothetical protein [Candidatus Diapherotrites archaeon]MDZ4256258.1 hypothetical protein [archaeon]